ncbi:hypothetical protein K1719_032792 [Acacia pycnantha]|nr:hypothetical protein K1719_032792 [Acacia pycnantha]
MTNSSSIVARKVSLVSSIFLPSFPILVLLSHHPQALSKITCNRLQHVGLFPFLIQNPLPPMARNKEVAALCGGGYGCPFRLLCSQTQIPIRNEYVDAAIGAAALDLSFSITISYAILFWRLIIAMRKEIQDEAAGGLESIRSP